MPTLSNHDSRTRPATGQGKEGVPFRQFFEMRLQHCDLVLARVLDYVSPGGTADIISCYRHRFIFSPREPFDAPVRIRFGGVTGSWGDPPNLTGDTSFLFLSSSGGRIWETYLGHLPLFDIDGRLMCAIFNVAPAQWTEVPEAIAASMWAPQTSRLINGEAADTFVPFDLLEAYLSALVKELDGDAFSPVMLKPEPLSQHLIPRTALPVLPAPMQPKTPPAPPEETRWFRRAIKKFP